MFDFLDDEENAISILKDDHNKLKDLFDEFEGTDSRRLRIKIANEAIETLKLHAAMEEHIFYPAARSCTDSFHMDEADEEHHVAKILVAELDSMDNADSHFDAKFKVLSEAVRHHIKEEESNIFPSVKSADMDLVALGQEMLSLRRRLMQKGVPKSPEERMVATEKKKSPTDTRAAANGKSAKASRKVPAHIKGHAKNHSHTRTGAPL
jgi:hemerythrin superfamily protein